MFQGSIGKMSPAAVGAAALGCLVLAVACERTRPRAELPGGGDFEAVALEFVGALVARDYAGAYAMTSREYRQAHTEEGLRAAFEEIVPLDWRVQGGTEVTATLADWPARRGSDLGWAYVGILGDVDHEGVAVIVAAEDGRAVIREIEFGKP